MLVVVKEAFRHDLDSRDQRLVLRWITVTKEVFMGFDLFEMVDRSSISWVDQRKVLRCYGCDLPSNVWKVLQWQAKMIRNCDLKLVFISRFFFLGGQGKLHFITLNYPLDYILHPKLSDCILCTINYHTYHTYQTLHLGVIFTNIFNKHMLLTQVKQN